MKKRQHEFLDARLRQQIQESVQDMGFSDTQKALIIQEAERNPPAPWRKSFADRFWNGTLELPLLPLAVLGGFGLLTLAFPSLQLLAVDNTQAALLLSSVHSGTELLQSGVSSI